MILIPMKSLSILPTRHKLVRLSIYFLTLDNSSRIIGSGEMGDPTGSFKREEESSKTYYEQHENYQRGNIFIGRRTYSRTSFSSITIKE